MSFEQKRRALITGASSGIGKTVAFAKAGIDVVLVSCSVNVNFDRSKMLTPEIVAQSILHTAMLPPQAVVDELTLMSNAGVL